MKLAILGAVLCALAIPLAGCNTLTADINSVTGALSSPQATQAAANLKAGAAALVCFVNSLATVNAQIAAQTAGNSRKATIYIRDSNTVLVASSALCAALGGSVTGSTIVPQNAALTPIAIPAGAK